jgi:hypothetical protein
MGYFTAGKLKQLKWQGKLVEGQMVGKMLEKSNPLKQIARAVCRVIGASGGGLEVFRPKIEKWFRNFNTLPNT